MATQAEQQRQERKDARAAARNRQSKEARLADRIVRISRGGERSAQCNNAKRAEVIARARARLMRMVERHDREGVGGYKA